MNPKITILLATYNRAHLIEETLLSIQDQTYAHFECLITDDRSTDNTPEIVSTFCEDDKRFLYFKKPDNYLQGLSATRNFGLDLAKQRQAGYIQFFDDDDIMHPEKLELQIKRLIDNQLDLILCGSKNFQIEYQIGFENHHFSAIKSPADFYLTGLLHFGAPIPLFRFDYINQLRFNENLFYAEEWELFVRLFYAFPPKIDAVNRILFYRRKHPESITESNDENFSKQKTSAITGTILFDFLTTKNLHSKLSLIHFTKNFTFRQYDYKRLTKIQDITRNKCFSAVLLIKIRLIVALHRFFYRFVIWFLK